MPAEGHRFGAATPLHPGEWLPLAYFCHTAFVGLVLGHARPGSRSALLAPVALGLLPLWMRRLGRVGGIARDWLPLAVVPIAFWQVDRLDVGLDTAGLVEQWLAWDRLLLDGWRLRAAVESLGPVLPWLLELGYALLYALPPLAVGVLTLCGRRDRVGAFLFTFLLGTLTSYALLPLFPSRSPYLVFPGHDLPPFDGFWRHLNLWVLARLDIETSVFPSGHVTVAFSTAFGMMLALPERRIVGRALLALALAIAVATVYGRYHYAVDGLAALAVSLAAAAASAALRRVERRATGLARGSPLAHGSASTLP
jgi:membrane-associated phospholipid phosphatase